MLARGSIDSGAMTALELGDFPVVSEVVIVHGVDGAPIEAVHARPEGRPRRGLVLHPDIMGLRPLFDEMCTRLASHGIAVIATEPFARYTPEERAVTDATGRMGWIAGLSDEEQIGDLTRAADRLVVDDDVTHIAVLGFCMGGMYALKAAATQRFDRAVSFYGMIRVPEAWQGPELAEPLDVVADACPTLAILGGADPFTPPEDIEALESIWADRNDCEVVVYPEAEHGFVHDSARPAHRADDAADAWRRTLDWLAPD